MAKLSKYFRGHPIHATRPGFGLVAALSGPGYEFIGRLRDAFIKEGNLILQVPDANIHVTLAQATLVIDQDGSYDPATLPHDLLHRMLQVARRAAAASPSCGNFVCTGRLVVLGREIPSHLAVEVKPIDPAALKAFQANVSAALRDAMMLEAAGTSSAVMRYDEDSSTLVGRGWKLQLWLHQERRLPRTRYSRSA